MTKEQKKELLATATSQGPVLPAVYGEGLSIDDLAKDAGHGLQNVTASDLTTPILRILQSNSPQCKKTEGEYIPGASEGMFLNTVTNEVTDGDKGLVVIPAYFEKIYCEWKPNRGGFVAIHPVNTPLKDQTKQVTDKDGKVVQALPNGNTLVETNQHYALVLRDNGNFEPVVIPMVSTALKSSRLWNSLMKKVVLQNSLGQHFTPASYYMTYKLTTKARAKDKYSWHGFAIEPAGKTPTKELYEAAKAFEAAVSSGKVRVKMDQAMTESSEPAVVSETEDDGIPF